MIPVNTMASEIVAVLETLDTCDPP